MPDMVCVKGYSVTVSIPTVIEKGGKRVTVSDEAMAQACKELSDELQELNFGNLLKSTGQGIAEENFLRFRPIVEVEQGG